MKFPLGGLGDRAVGARRTGQRAAQKHLRPLAKKRYGLARPGLATAAEEHVTVEMEDVLAPRDVEPEKVGVKRSGTSCLGRHGLASEEPRGDRAPCRGRVVGDLEPAVPVRR